MDVVKVKELNYGPTKVSMLDNGEITKPAEEEFYTILVVIYMMENGFTIKRMEKEFISMKMVQNTKEVGKMTSNLVSEYKNGQTARSTKVNIKTGLKMEREF
jgi:hypothetical protein